VGGSGGTKFKITDNFPKNIFKKILILDLKEFLNIILIIKNKN